MLKEELAALCTELYYNGKQTNDKTLDERDFGKLIDSARGTAILSAYWMARKQDLSIEESGFLNSYLEEHELDVTEGRKGHEVILPTKSITLPHGYGIYEVSSVDGSCGCDEFMRIEAGAGWQTKGDHDEVFFEPLANKIKLYNVPDCLKKVTVMMISETSDTIAGDIIWPIINMIFGLTLKVKGFPADMQDDGNPNIMMVNKKIAEAQMT